MQERRRIRLPDGMTRDQAPKLEQVVKAKYGSDFRLESIDLDEGLASFVRTVDVATVSSIKDTKLLEVILPDSWAVPSAGDKANASLAEQHPGYHLLRFEPHVKRAILARITDDVLATRAAVAEALGVKPWDVEVKRRRGGGFVLTRLPPRYTPSRHDAKLQEVAETKVPGGHPGWFARVDGQTLTGEIVPAELPTFPAVIPTDMSLLGRDPDRTRFGMKLPRPGEDAGVGAGVDWTASAAMLLGGTPGSGKRQPLTAPIPVPVSQRFPSGWARMGDLLPGDEVYTATGAATRVEWLSPIVERPTWRLTLADGQQVDADPDHLWPVSTFADRCAPQPAPAGRDAAIASRVKASREPLDVFALARLLGRPLDVVRAAIEDAALVPDPQGRYAPAEVWRALAPAQRAGAPAVRLATTAEIAADVSEGGALTGYALPLTGPIAGPRLAGVDPALLASQVAAGGRIAPAVLRACRAQREALLAAILRAAPTAVTPTGETVVSLPDGPGAGDVVELARSLGAWARAGAPGDGTGEVRLAPAGQGWNRVVAARRVGVTPGRCLRVADPAHLYLTGAFLPTHNTVTLNVMLADALASGSQCVVVDDPAKSVDFLWAKPYLRENGWGCGSDRAAVTALALAYEEGQRRARVLADKRIVNWLDMPDGERFTPLFIIVDELSALTVPDPVPKGVPKDSPVYMEIAEANFQKAMVNRYIGKIIAEERFVGVRIVLSTQVTNNSTGVSPSLKAKIGHKILQGSNPSPQARKQAFSDDTAVPSIPDNVRGGGKTAKGVGSAELEGQTPFVYKSVFATTQDYTDELERRHVPHNTTPDPTPSQIARYAQTLEDAGDVDDGPPASRFDEGGFGDPGGHIEELKGAAKANHDRAVEMAQHRVSTTGGRKPRDERLRSPEEAAHRLNVAGGR